MDTLAKMAALVVFLAAALSAAFSLDSTENEQDQNSPIMFPGPPTKDLPRVFDSEPACRGQFRHHAKIVGDDQASWSGSLIKPTAILTDGSVATYKKFTIRLGTISLEGADSSVTVQSIWALVHPEYRLGERFHNDIAVILLNVAVPLGKSIWPVKLPSIYEVGETFTGRQALISGFGLIDVTGETLQERLQFAEVTVINNDLCKRFFEPKYITDSTLCAGDKKTGFCIGDHGGALVIRTRGQYKQIGIASFVGLNCGADIPGGYVRVTSYLDWIQRAAGNLDVADWGAAQDSYCN